MWAVNLVESSLSALPERARAKIPSTSEPLRRSVWGVVDEEDAGDMAREFAYGLARRAYGLQAESVGKT
jgi:hypothetical protein